MYVVAIQEYIQISLFPDVFIQPMVFDGSEWGQQLKSTRQTVNIEIINNYIELI